jgi:glycosyltransferase involved in cell wall biosynthesis
LLRSAALEYVEYDSVVARWLTAAGGAAVAGALWMLGQKSRAFALLSRIHRSGGSARVTTAIEHALASLNRQERGGKSTGLWTLYEEHTRESLRIGQAAGIVRRPESLFGYRAIVLKAASEGEKGVLVVDYSYIFPVFAALFDLEAIARRYYIVLEPSWRGLCTADILSYSRFDFPVFIETIEPRDKAFIEGLGANFVTVPTAANWWVDHRLVRERPGVERDIDVIMVAAWSDVKRHWRFFKVLSDLRSRGHRLKVALVGYKSDKSRHAIEDEARHFGILDQLRICERLSLDEVGALLARSKVHVLWSRKEGSNRAIVEALFADVPIIVRDGLSYGYHYPYVNEATGCFATEATLGDAILRVLEGREQYHPRDWAIANMTCQAATEVLDSRLQEYATALGEPWTRGLAVKTVHLDSQRYWDPEEVRRFEADYEYLRSQLRENSPRAITVLS